MYPIVSLDIETTGLDPRRDAIIEIGAVSFDGEKITGTWQSLINPQRPIPTVITQLTSITNEMVINAPPIKAVIQDFADFVGDLPVVGHNISFDLSFLKVHQNFDLNPVNDTFEIAAVLLPTAPRYSLSALVNRFGVSNLNPHRAKDDAEATMAVFRKLHDLVGELPLHLLAEIVQASLNLSWDGRWFFSEVLKGRTKGPIPARQTTQKEYGVLFEAPSELLAQPLKPNPELLPLDIEETTAILSPGGPFSTYLENFESRNEQVEMLQAVAGALSNSQHLMVEAGTGIGKSYAYLVPAALWSTRNNTRVVISTNTLNLQDQLIKKDIPDVKRALGLNLRASVLKGRINYLCPRRLEALRHRKPRDANELRLMAKVLVWLEQGGSGELAEVNLTGPAEKEVWSRLSAQDELCSAEVCLNRMGGVCPYFKARQAALGAHIVVVNHALLLSDVVANHRVLPEYKYLIVDEGHHIEDASTGALSYRVTRVEVERLFDELGGSASGILGRVSSILQRLLKPSDYASVTTAIEKATDLAYRAENDTRKFFTAIDEFMVQERDGGEVGDYGQQVRVVPATSHQPKWDDIEITWDDASQPMESLMRLLDNLLRDMGDEPLAGKDEMEDVTGDLTSTVHRLKEIHEHISALVFELDANTIYWIEQDAKYNSLSLNFAPLHIGPLMESALWHTKDCVIITSATLTANNNFEYIRSRLNADEADELILGSPFDYENSALLFLPTDMPEPIDYKNYQRYVERAVLQTAKATGGRMLVLFTSYRQLLETSRVISPLLAKEKVQVFEQGTGASPTSLLDSFRETERAVLLGTRSFWEGVDVPGEALSVLMIVKLPFDVPNDPIIQSRSETFENAFSEYTLPEAILRFRQGFGRLIRTQSDRGVVAVLDRRVRSKQYGQLFLQSVPNCHLVESTIEDLPEAAKRWLTLKNKNLFKENT
ncbi:MAG: helicase C-terminal domain-containing protein [Pelolinea sp.]|nr:helicase C-terminal domain-containing protein [Pelolinea sp.]